MSETLYSTVYGAHKLELSMQPSGCWHLVNLGTGQTFGDIWGTPDSAKKETERKLGVEKLEWEKQTLGLSFGVA